MGKTLGSIFSTVLAGPIGLIDKKLGQEISGVILTAAGAITGNPLLVSAGLYDLQQAFKPSPPKPSGAETGIKSPTPSRQGAYGRCGLIGPYVFYQTDPNSGVAGDVYAVHDNWWAPIDGVEGFYLGDDRVANGTGVVVGLPDGTYTDGKVEIDFRVGNRVNTVFADQHLVRELVQHHGARRWLSPDGTT